MSEPSSLGTLYGIGLGPGDPELITLKGYRLLQTVPTIFVPVRQPGQPSYAATIASPHLANAAGEVVELVYPMTKDREVQAAAWAASCEIIAGRLANERDAAFLTEGDPGVFSTFSYTMAGLRAIRPDLRVEVVPGVTSVTAAAAAAALPLAERDERIAIVPATYDEGRLRQILVEFDSIVLMKVNSVFDRVLPLLEELGLADRAVYVRRCGRPEQEVVRDLRALLGRPLDYFSIVLIRK